MRLQQARIGHLGEVRGHTERERALERAARVAWGIERVELQAAERERGEAGARIARMLCEETLERDELRARVAIAPTEQLSLGLG